MISLHIQSAMWKTRIQTNKFQSMKLRLKLFIKQKFKNKNLLKQQLLGKKKAFEYSFPLQLQINDQEQTREILTLKISQQNKFIQDLQTQNKGLQSTVQIQQSQIHKLETTVQNLSNQNYELQTTDQDQQTQINKLESKLHTTVQDFQTQNQGLQTADQNQQTLINNFQTTTQELQNSIGKQQMTIQDLLTQSQSFQTTKQDWQPSINKIETTVQDLQTLINKLQMNVQDLQTQNKGLQSTDQNLQAQINGFQSQFNKISTTQQDNQIQINKLLPLYQNTHEYLQQIQKQPSTIPSFTSNPNSNFITISGNKFTANCGGSWYGIKSTKIQAGGIQKFQYQILPGSDQLPSPQHVIGITTQQSNLIKYWNDSGSICFCQYEGSIYSYGVVQKIVFVPVQIKFYDIICMVIDYNCSTVRFMINNEPFAQPIRIDSARLNLSQLHVFIDFSSKKVFEFI